MKSMGSGCENLAVQLGLKGLILTYNNKPQGRKIDDLIYMVLTD